MSDSISLMLLQNSHFISSAPETPHVYCEHFQIGTSSIICEAQVFMLYKVSGQLKVQYTLPHPYHGVA